MGIYASSAQAAQPIRLVICGGGASAVLLLTALKDRCERAVVATVIEPRGELGAGLAYSTSCPIHLLNTRACNMSVGEDAEDFAQWLRNTRRRRVFNWTGQDFAPRRAYGEYLQTALERIREAPHIRLSWLRSCADSIIARGNEWEVVPAQGEPVMADVVVLATGNEAPRMIGTGLAPQLRDLIIENPWDTERKADIPLDAPVVLAGTSLTAVDVAAELLHRRHRGPIIAFSRRGLLPRSHGRAAVLPESSRRALPSSLRELVARVRKLSAEDSRGERWRGVFTELRSMAPALWRGWTLAERRRFLRHVRPFWDAHRHRVAPRVRARITRAVAHGQLEIVRGRIADIALVPSAAALRVTLRQPSGKRRVLEAARLINCTGPESHPLRTANSLLQNLLADGLARTDALELGLATDQRSRLIAGNGSVHPTLYALGSLARGSQWELTSVPEIREQAQLVAREIEQHAARRPVQPTAALRLAPRDWAALACAWRRAVEER